MNFIVGGNAQGKTNILEGIYFLSTAKSHRTNQDNDLIQHEKKWFYIKGRAVSRGLSTVVEIINTCDERKKIKIDGKSQGKISSIIGKINTVMFSPEDLSLVKGSPSERRRFLDILISRISPSYLHLLQEYQSALRQRNELLKEIKKGYNNEKNGLNEHLETWDRLLVENGSEIVRQRMPIVSDLERIAADIHRELTHSHEALGIEYQSQLLCPNNDEPLNEFYIKSLGESIGLDIRQGSTSIGPHRDDLVLTINGLDARKFCSQGQQRTGVLSLKLANLEIMNLKIGDYPIVLLDDVTSELDDSRISFLFNLLSNIPVQTFLTSTNIDSRSIGRIDLSNSYTFVVENGMVREREGMRDEG